MRRKCLILLVSWHPTMRKTFPVATLDHGSIDGDPAGMLRGRILEGFPIYICVVTPPPLKLACLFPKNFDL